MSIIRTNQITDTAGTGSPSFPNGIAGAVLQVKQGVQATPFTISTTEADIMSVQITPKSTSSKI